MPTRAADGPSSAPRQRLNHGIGPGGRPSRSGDTLTIPATSTATFYHSMSPCVATTAQPILRTSVAVILNTSDAQYMSGRLVAVRVSEAPASTAEYLVGGR
jgi:hypothetical protein